MSSASSSVGLALGICCALAGVSTAIDTFPNVDYIASGYDIVHGNPHADTIDPGFRYKIIQLSYNTSQTTSDLKWQVPDQTQVLRTLSCSYDATSSEIIGSSSYQDSLKQSVSVDGGYEGVAKASFSASTDYQNTKKGTTNDHTRYTESKAECIIYNSKILPYIPLAFTSSFLNGVASLPLTYDAVAYTQFLSFFGTHYVRELSMGASVVQRSSFSDDAWTEMTSSDLDIKTAASFSYAGWSGSVKTETDVQKQQQQAFEEKRENSYENYIGARPAQDGDWVGWSKSVESEVLPMKYTLTPITSLFTTFYFPQDKDIAAKAAAMQTALDAYCGNTPGCETPGPDPPLPSSTGPACTLCSSCGGKWTQEVGKGLHQWDWGPYYTSGHLCSEGYEVRWDEPTLCCEPDRAKMAMCAGSCQGSYPYEQGRVDHDGDWGSWNVLMDCVSDYETLPADNHPVEPVVCSAEQDSQCRICSSCGNAFPNEMGRMVHQGSWSSWSGYGAGCAEDYVPRWDEVRLCCKD